MDSVLDKPIVLSVNRLWQPIGVKAVRQAIIDMTGGADGHNPPHLAFDIVYEQDDEGNYDFNSVLSITPTRWDDWVKLPIRHFDPVIHSAKMEIRCPTVIIAAHFSKTIRKVPHATPRAIWERDQSRCQYTGEPLTKSTGNIDHIVPKDRGGRDSWKNMVLCRKDLNLKKGNRLNSEIGYKLLREPIEPLPIPITATIREIKHRDWNHFITVSA